MATSSHSLKETLIQLPVCSTLARTFRCVSMAPLDTPVVPPVYCKSATSSLESSTGVKPLPCPIDNASRKLTAPGRFHSGTIFLTYFTAALTMVRFMKGNKSPTCVVMMCLTGVRDRTLSRVFAKFSMIMIALAPESFN